MEKQPSLRERSPHGRRSSRERSRRSSRECSRDGRRSSRERTRAGRRASRERSREGRRHASPERRLRGRTRSPTPDGADVVAEAPTVAYNRANLHLLLADKDEMRALVKVEQLLAAHSRDHPTSAPTTVIKGLFARFRFKQYYIGPVHRWLEEDWIEVQVPEDECAEPVTIQVKNVSSQNPLADPGWQECGEAEVAHLYAYMRRHARSLLLSEAAEAAWLRRAALRWHDKHYGEPDEVLRQHVASLIEDLQDREGVRRMERQFEHEKRPAERPAAAASRGSRERRGPSPQRRQLPSPRHDREHERRTASPRRQEREREQGRPAAPVQQQLQELPRRGRQEPEQRQRGEEPQRGRHSAGERPRREEQPARQEQARPRTTEAGLSAAAGDVRLPPGWQHGCQQQPNDAAEAAASKALPHVNMQPQQQIVALPATGDPAARDFITLAGSGAAAAAQPEQQTPVAPLQQEGQAPMERRQDSPAPAMPGASNGGSKEQYDQRPTAASNDELRAARQAAAAALAKHSGRSPAPSSKQHGLPTSSGQQQQAAATGSIGRPSPQLSGPGMSQPSAAAERPLPAAADGSSAVPKAADTAAATPQPAGVGGKRKRAAIVWQPQESRPGDVPLQPLDQAKPADSKATVAASKAAAPTLAKAGQGKDSTQPKSKQQKVAANFSITVQNTPPLEEGELRVETSAGGSSSGHVARMPSGLGGSGAAAAAAVGAPYPHRLASGDGFAFPPGFGGGPGVAAGSSGMQWEQDYPSGHEVNGAGTFTVRVHMRPPTAAAASHDQHMLGGGGGAGSGTLAGKFDSMAAQRHLDSPTALPDRAPRHTFVVHAANAAANYSYAAEQEVQPVFPAAVMAAANANANRYDVAADAAMAAAAVGYGSYQQQQQLAMHDAGLMPLPAYGSGSVSAQAAAADEVSSMQGGRHVSRGGGGSGGRSVQIDRLPSHGASSGGSKAAEEPFWDPMWQWEFRMVRLLRERKSPVLITELHGTDPLPPYWRQTFGAYSFYMARRKQLFVVHRSKDGPEQDTVTAASGARAFLHLKKRLLQYLADHQHRAHVSQVFPHMASDIEYLAAGLRHEVERDFTYFVKKYMRDEVHVRPAEGGCMMELKPFSAGGKGAAQLKPGFKGVCNYYARPAGCTKGDRCTFAHAPQRQFADPLPGKGP